MQEVQCIFPLLPSPGSTINDTWRGRSRAHACRRRPQYFKGAKVPNFDEKPPVFFLSEQSRMSTLSQSKFVALARYVN